MRLKNIAETFKKDLQDPEFVQEYLQDALADNTTSFLIAIRDVVEANQGMAKLAEELNISLDSLEQAFSETEDPHFSIIQKVLHALTMEISIVPRQSSQSVS